MFLLAARHKLFHSESIIKRFYTIPNRVKDIIEDATQKNDVALFMKGTPGWPQCGFSRLVVQVLDISGVENYKAIDVLADDEMRTGIKEYSDWPTIPQLYIKGEFIGGADIVRSMYESGDLKKLLIDKGIVKKNGE